jgi:hypothetical protein
MPTDSIEAAETPQPLRPSTSSFAARRIARNAASRFSTSALSARAGTTLWRRQELPVSSPISARRTRRKGKLTIKVLADLADGSQMRFTGDHYVSKYKSLVAQGYEGKALIHALLTEDWGALPLRVRIQENGNDVAVIPYR